MGGVSVVEGVYLWMLQSIASIVCVPLSSLFRVTDVTAKRCGSVEYSIGITRVSTPDSCLPPLTHDSQGLTLFLHLIPLSESELQKQILRQAKKD